ncbi:hypothetical protein CGSMWGv00703C2mash_03101 [Gardnerella pickettii 00703C2mash]|nr:hypothetical protein CGSMWGv00703C2mash_03101 [Gardnerella pickettii 00703C2mash]
MPEPNHALKELETRYAISSSVKANKKAAARCVKQLATASRSGLT